MNLSRVWLFLLHVYMFHFTVNPVTDRQTDGQTELTSGILTQDDKRHADVIAVPRGVNDVDGCTV